MVIVRVDFDRATEAEVDLDNLAELVRRLRTIVEGFRKLTALPKTDEPGIRFEVDYQGGLTTEEIEVIGEAIERHAGLSASRTQATCTVTLPTDTGGSAEQANSVWVEFRITQGRDWSPADIDEAVSALEEAIDRPARDLFPFKRDIRPVLLRVYLAIEPERATIARLQNTRRSARGPFRDMPGRSFDDMVLVSHTVVANNVPGAV